MVTPALKAMVEAMAAELRRQHEDDPVGAFVEQVGGSEMLFGVQVDLEKVARAGLAAPGLIEALTQARPLGWSDAATYHHLSAMFDAILKDDPTATY